MVGGELTTSCGKCCPFLLCQFKLFTSGQWKEYSKIKNASGPGRACIHMWCKQPWEEKGLPRTQEWAGLQVFYWLGWGALFCWLSTRGVDRARAEPNTPKGQASFRKLHEEPGSSVRQGLVTIHIAQPLWGQTGAILLPATSSRP